MWSVSLSPHVQDISRDPPSSQGTDYPLTEFHFFVSVPPWGLKRLIRTNPEPRFHETHHT